MVGECIPFGWDQCRWMQVPAGYTVWVRVRVRVEDRIRVRFRVPTYPVN